jgi:hypothetical protein
MLSPLLTRFHLVIFDKCFSDNSESCFEKNVPTDVLCTVLMMFCSIYSDKLCVEARPTLRWPATNSALTRDKLCAAVSVCATNSALVRDKLCAAVFYTIEISGESYPHSATNSALAGHVIQRLF